MDKITGLEEKLPVDNSLSYHPPGHHRALADRPKAGGTVYKKLFD